VCGRYILAEKALAERALEVDQIHWNYEVSYNVAPTQAVPVVRSVPDEREGIFHREGVLMRWGLVPFWARGVPPKFSTINATVERFETAPAFRDAWARGQRCILPCAGFYEWHVAPDGRKEPFFIKLVDREVFGFAGLWERSRTAEGEWVASCTLLTMPANKLMGEIHNAKQRMPVILSAEDHQAWLRGSAAEAKATLRAYPDDLMLAYRVGPRVSSPKNNDPQLIEPI
jgi:putative SOS response-associated peptidase YedK